MERELWDLRATYLKYTLYANIEKEVKYFVNTFDEATRVYQMSLHETLIFQMQDYIDELSVEQLYEVNSRRAKFLREVEENIYLQKKSCQAITGIRPFPEQRVNILIARSNVEIR